MDTETIRDFVVRVFLLFGVALNVHGWFDDKVTDVRVVQPQELHNGGACAELEMLTWSGPTGQVTQRTIGQLRVVDPTHDPLCGPEFLQDTVDHELWCHAVLFLLYGDTGGKHDRLGCEATQVRRLSASGDGPRTTNRPGRGSLIPQDQHKGAAPYFNP